MASRWPATTASLCRSSVADRLTGIRRISVFVAVILLTTSSGLKSGVTVDENTLLANDWW